MCITTRNDIDSVTSDVGLNGGKWKPKTWTKIKVTFLKGVAILYVDGETQRLPSSTKGRGKSGRRYPRKSDSTAATN